jgi:regulator of sigma E protease
MNVLVQAGQLILSLSILIILHELGHFIPARLFKIRVEKFYLFFDPWISLFKVKKGDTEYGMGWLPLGGYVKIAGMVDESMDKEQMKEEPKEWEFRAKPAWQRLIVMLGGVTVNILLGFLIYAMIVFVWGNTTLPVENAKYGIMCDSVALNIGLRNGDKIISFDGKKVENFGEIPSRMALDRPNTVEVERSGRKEIITIPKGFVDSLLHKGVKSFIDPRGLFAVSSFSPGSGAEKAGLKKGDFLVGVNGEPLLFYDQFPTRLAQHKNEKVKVSVIRDGKSLEKEVQLDKDGKLGVYPLSPYAFLDLKTTQYSLLTAIPKGVELGVEKLKSYIKQFKIIFSKEGVKQIGGFGTFASMFGTTWDWFAFWNLTAFISIILAVMNILPIPALDGGHVLFLLYEIITRRKPNQKAMEYAQLAGMVLLLALAVFANGNDIFRLFKH